MSDPAPATPTATATATATATNTAAARDTPAAAATAAPTVAPAGGDTPITIATPGIVATLLPYGARLTSLRVCDRAGFWTEVCLGYADPGAYRREATPSYLGAVVGRYANRIKDGRFAVDGETFQISTNEGRNTLHGGTVGYDRRDWTVRERTSSSVTFELLDDGWEGFPGRVRATVAYAVSGTTLRVALTGTPLDRATPILLTTHAFYNLGGTTRPIWDHELWVRARRVVGVDDANIPTGALHAVANLRDGALDFSRADPPRALAAAQPAGGIDHCYVLDALPAGDAAAAPPAPALSLTHRGTGIRMRVYTDQAAVQVYTSGGMDGSLACATGAAGQYAAVAVEPQGWIDAINNPAWGQDQIYRPGGMPHTHATEYCFDIVPETAAADRQP